MNNNNETIDKYVEEMTPINFTFSIKEIWYAQMIVDIITDKTSPINDSRE